MTDMKKIALSCLLIFAILLSFIVSYINFTNAYVNNIDLGSFNFTELKEHYPGMEQTAYTLKQVMADNGRDTDFSLNTKFTDKLSYWIIIEDRADLIDWSNRCYLATTPAERKFYLSARYRLGNDINAATANIIPIGLQGGLVSDEMFSGYFDGQGFEISNLSLSTYEGYYKSFNGASYTTSPFANQYYGMFSMVMGTVENIGLRNPVYNGNPIIFPQFCGSLVGINYGTVQYAYVITNDTASLRHSLYPGSQQAGVVHTNAAGATIDNVYLGGGLAHSSPASGLSYNPVVYTNAGNLSSCYYDNTKYTASTEGVTTGYAEVIGTPTTNLCTFNGVFSGSGGLPPMTSRWYRDQYSGVANYSSEAYPRLCGFKVSSYAANSASNPYWLARPADIIFMSKVISSTSAFATTKTYRLYNCIDMSTISEDAYVCSTTPFNTSTFEGTASGSGTVGTNCACGSSHPGTGDQLLSHSIVNLKIKSFIQSGSTVFQGMFYNAASNAALSVNIKNVNFVGGGVLLPNFNQNEAQGVIVYSGLVMSRGGSTTLNNVHSSASIKARTKTSAEESRKYYYSLYAGGLIGYNQNYTLTMNNCSTSGTVEPGVYSFTSAGTSAVVSGIGGMVGYRLGNSTTYRLNLTNCVNFSDVKGITFNEKHSGTNAAAYPSAYIGGLIGHNGTSNAYADIDNVVNSGTIRSFDAVANPAERPVNNYFIGGIFGYGPVSYSTVTGGGTATTRMDNKGTIFAEAVRDGGSETYTSAYVGGIAGTSMTVNNYGYSGAVNNGKIVIAEDILTVRAAGIAASAIYVTNCENKTHFVNTENGTAPLKLSAVKYVSSVAGLGGTATNATNTLDLNVEVAGNTGAVYVSGASSYTSAASSASNSINDGSVTVKVTSNSAAVYVSGVASGSATGCENKKPVTANIVSTAASVYINGVCHGSGSGSTNSSAVTSNVTSASNAVYLSGVCNGAATNGSANNGAVNMNVTNATAVTYTNGVSYGAATSCTNGGPVTAMIDNTTQTTYVSGVSLGSSTVSGCTNNGAINVTKRGLSTTLYVSGISSYNYSGNVSSCTNNGKIKVNRVLPASTLTTTIYAYVTGIKSSTSTSVITDCENTGDITLDFYYETVNSTNALTPTAYVSGIAHNVQSMNRCVNRGNITVGENQPFCATTAYVSGLFYSVSTPGSVETASNFFIANCQNFGKVGNGANIGKAGDAKTGRNLFFSGIGYNTSCYTYQCVNSGEVKLANLETGLPSGLINYYISGLFYTNSSVDAYRTSNPANSGLFGLANAGTLTFDHGDTSINGTGSWTGKVYVSGVITNLGSATATNPVARLNTGNIVNAGAINVNLRADAYPGNAGSDGFVTTTPSLVIGGISATPGHNTSVTTETPLSGCANLGNINATLTGEGAKGLVYNVGGIAGNSASSSNAANYQRLKIYDSVNGGSVKVNSVIPTDTTQTNNSYQCGVGGILGYAYQRVAATVTTLNSGVYNSVNFGTVKGVTSAGGIVGRDACELSNVLNFGDVSAANNSLARSGGIVGSLRFYNRSYATASPMFSIQRAVNYGTVGIGQTNGAKGGIFGELSAFTASYGSRVLDNIINAYDANAGTSSAVPFAASSYIGTQAGTFTATNLFDLSSSAGNYGSVFTTTAKNANAPTDANSIYNESFPWRASPLDSWAYLVPEDSARNTQSGTVYTPYEYGIYAVSDSRGTVADTYPSANIYLDNCNPVNPGQNTPSSQWQTASGAPAALALCRQKKINDQAEILALELKNTYNNVETSIRSAEVDAVQQTVTFYVIKDNFYPGDYAPFGPYQLLAGSKYTDISSNATFDLDYTLDNIPTDPVWDGTSVNVGKLMVKADAGNTKEWKVIFVFKQTDDPLSPLRVREGISITNISSATAYRENPIEEIPSSDPDAATAPDRAFRLQLPVSCAQNNTLIFMLDTTNMQYLNYISGQPVLRTDNTSLETADGSQVIAVTTTGSYDGYSKMPYTPIPPLTDGTDTTSINNRNYYQTYKVLPLNPERTNIALGDYKDYNGQMTLNLQLHVNLPAGDYRVKFETVYGVYYFYFTREASNITDILNTPYIWREASSYLSLSKNAANYTLTSTNACPYGDAPALSRLFDKNTGAPIDPMSTAGIFYTKPQLVTGASIDGFKLVSITTDDITLSSVYTFTFDVVAADGITRREWTISVTTYPVVKPIDNITGMFGSLPYTQDQVTSPEYIEDHFYINENDGQTMTMNYTLLSTTTTSTIYGVGTTANFAYQVFRNGELLDPAEYSSYLQITGTYPALTVRALSAAETGGENLMPGGKYEIRGVYRRSGAPISLAYTDGNGEKQYPIQDEGGNAITELAWEDVPYTAFTFYKQIGSKLSYALGLELPRVPIEVRVTSRGTMKVPVEWATRDASLFDYTAFNNQVGYNVLLEENAKAYRHDIFDIEVLYKRAYTFGNFSPSFILPENATLQWYIGSDPDGWYSSDLNEDDWSSENLPTNFSSGRVIHYRVLAQNTNYWQYYNLSLKIYENLNKILNVDFVYDGFTPDPGFQASANIKDTDPDPSGNRIMGNLTVFNNLDSSFISEFLPPGEYLCDVHVPYGYEATVTMHIVGPDTVLPYNNDFIVNNKIVKGFNWIYATGEFSSEVTITVTIRKKTTAVPWGIYRR